MKTSRKIKHSKGSIAFDIFNYIFVGVIAFTMVYPFWYVLVKSVTPFSELVNSKFIFFPKNVTFEAYRYIMATDKMLNGLFISVGVTVVATLYRLFLTSTAAYALSKRDLPGRNIIFRLIVFTMFFHGGLIPTYLLIKALGLTNNLLVLILPHAVSAYNLIVMRTFFDSLPLEIEESARLDGASYFQIFRKIIIPCSMSSVATIALFIAVNAWNAWYEPMLYLNKKELWPMALVIRDILVKSDIDSLNSGYESTGYMMSESVKMAMVIIAIVPIMIVYPFLQKYFAKGVMIGAVKA